MDFDWRANTYSRFPAASSTPIIDACIQLHASHRIPRPTWPRCTRWRVWCWTCRPVPASPGAQSQFSVYHGAAVGLVRGKAGIQGVQPTAGEQSPVKRVRELARATGDAPSPRTRRRWLVEATYEHHWSRRSSPSRWKSYDKPAERRPPRGQVRDQAAVNLPATSSRRCRECFGGSTRWTTSNAGSRRRACSRFRGRRRSGGVQFSCG